MLALFGDSGADAVLYGHIHQPHLRWIGGRAVINPGSAGQPFDGDRRAACALIEAGPGGLGGQGGLGVEFIRVPYDYELVVADARRLGLPAIDTYEAMIRGARWPY
ncbi:MAG: metallophosphoesterase family protein [Bacillota bacterium]